MNSLNSVHLIGNLGKDPEVKAFENGNKIAEVNIATSRRVKKGEEYESVTDWHRIVFWGRLADLVEKYLKKGSKIAVIGELRTRSYETKEGEKRYVTEVNANKLVFLDKKGTIEDVHTEEGDDDLPF